MTLMHYGFVKVGSATPEIRVADVAYNTNQTLIECEKANTAGVQLLVLPELGICGYTCADLFNQPLLISACEQAIRNIAQATASYPMLLLAGVPVYTFGRLYNCAVAIHRGKVLAVIPKRYLPNYNEFYEDRHFVPYTESGVKHITYCGTEVPFGSEILFRDSSHPLFTVGVELCEDLWVPQPPSIAHALHGATVIANLSAGNEIIGKADYRRMLVKSQSGRLCCGYVYTCAGAGESTTDMVFSGHNLIAENGGILTESKLFTSGLIVSEIDVEKLSVERRRTSTFFDAADAVPYTEIPFDSQTECETLTRLIPALPFVPQESAERSERAELILTMQAQALKKRLQVTGSKTAVIGISGGLDSTLALLVVARTFALLGKDNRDIIGITMPCFGTTGRTLHNSLRLMEEMHVTARTIPIANSVNQHFADIGQDPALRDVTYENSQARIRTLVLMDTANKENGLVIGTGDLSELALGWATYNGDHMSMYAVNTSVPKTLVKYLVSYEATRLGGTLQAILEDVLGTEISPELLPPDENGKIAQKTEDLVGPYELHDFFLYNVVRWGFAPKKVFFLAKYAFGDRYEVPTLLKWLRNFYRRFFNQQFKRSCIPDGVKIGSVTLSPRADWRMPSDASSALWLAEVEELEREYLTI